MIRAVQLKKYGAIKDSTQIVTLAQTKPGAHEVLVEVRAAGVRPLDVRLIEGRARLFLNYSLPCILGSDVSGVVVQVGSAVRSLKVGDEVFGSLDSSARSGALADYVVADESCFALKPRNLTHNEVALLPSAGLAAWQALTEIHRLMPGQKVLVHSAASTFGTVALQLAKYVGALTAATVPQCSYDSVKMLGVDILLDQERDLFRSLIKDYDLVLCVDDTTVRDSLYCVHSRGTIVCLEGLPDYVYMKSAKLSLLQKGMIWFSNRPIYNFAKQLGVEYRFLYRKVRVEELRQLSALCEQGIVRPVVSGVYSLDAFAEALDTVAAHPYTANVVIAM
jgi:alcohol dehydrogenase